VVSRGGSEDPGIHRMCGQIVDLCTMATECGDELAIQSIENFDETAWPSHRDERHRLLNVVPSTAIEYR